MRVPRKLFQCCLLVMLLLALPFSSAANSSTSSWPPAVSPAGPTLVTGPLGPNAVSVETGAAQLPVAIQIPAAAVDAGVEQSQIVDGVMLDPSGPWVVSWYEQTARLGEQGNTVMAGHLDYWDIGPAVFYNLVSVQKGDEIYVFGENGETFTYNATWARLYQLEELNSEAIRVIVGSTAVTSLTLITCGGEFDEATGQYLSRYVVRAELTPSTQTVTSQDFQT
jgi:hypothetical protein